MANNLTPSYLSNLIPGRVGDRVGYALRNAGNIALIRTKHVKTYNSFIPKTIRDWNNLRILHNASSIDSFKSRYKKEFFGDTNPFFRLDIGGGNIPHARLRLGLSHLAQHLFTHNLIDDPTCKSCGLESETVTHYLLRCPTFHTQRTVYLAGLLQTLDPRIIANLDDNLIVELFLYGDKDLPAINRTLFTMAQTFITSSNRFDNRYLAR